MPVTTLAHELEDLHRDVDVSYLRLKESNIDLEEQTAYLNSNISARLETYNYEILFTLRSVSPTYSLFVLAPDLAKVAFKPRTNVEWYVKAYENSIDLADIYGSNAMRIYLLLYLNTNLRILEGTIYVDKNRMAFFRLLPTLLL